jgi:hypothetical protein
LKFEIWLQTSFVPFPMPELAPRDQQREITNDMEARS